MGLNYGQRRGRLEQLDVQDDDSLIGYAISEHDMSFEKHDMQDVAKIVNQEIDEAEARIRDRNYLLG